jgi:hypothetical protein
MKQQIVLCAGIVALLSSAVSARADYVFNFNSLTPSTSDQSTNIANYMDTILGCSGCVTVSTGVAVAQKYNGDGHVVGPNGTSLTLGNSDGATNNSGPANTSWDSYISNTAADSNGNNPNQLSQGIVITLTKGFTLTGTFSFDYEIFPDGSCPDLSGHDCGTWSNPTANLPDLDFTANGSTPQSKTFWAVAPGTTDGTSTQSPNSGTCTHCEELAPQYIGTSGNFTLTGATSLSFMDWPATIGVDNLKLVTTSTPEPRGYALLLGGLMLAFFVGTKLRQSSAKSSN